MRRRFRGHRMPRQQSRASGAAVASAEANCFRCLTTIRVSSLQLPLVSWSSLNPRTEPSSTSIILSDLTAINRRKKQCIIDQPTVGQWTEVRPKLFDASTCAITILRWLLERKTGVIDKAELERERKKICIASSVAAAVLVVGSSTINCLGLK